MGCIFFDSLLPAALHFYGWTNYLSAATTRDRVRLHIFLSGRLLLAGRKGKKHGVSEFISRHLFQGLADRSIGFFLHFPSCLRLRIPISASTATFSNIESEHFQHSGCATTTSFRDFQRSTCSLLAKSQFPFRACESTLKRGASASVENPGYLYNTPELPCRHSLKLRGPDVLLMSPCFVRSGRGSVSGMHMQVSGLCFGCKSISIWFIIIPINSIR